MKLPGHAASIYFSLADALELANVRERCPRDPMGKITLCTECVRFPRRFFFEFSGPVPTSKSEWTRLIRGVSRYVPGPPRLVSCPSVGFLPP